jgi:hypothetical protein
VPKPKPFKRPGIEISSGGPKRVWRDGVKAEDLAVGDTVAEFGEVEAKDYRQSRGPMEPFIVLTSTVGRVEQFSPEVEVKAFVIPEEDVRDKPDWYPGHNA